jgi:hypothetical protein
MKQFLKHLITTLAAGSLLLLPQQAFAQTVYPNVQRSTLLTSGRIPIVGTGGIVADDSDLSFSVDTLTATKFSGALNGTVGATTPASGAFTTLTASGAATLTNATASLTLGTATEVGTLAVTATGALTITPKSGQDVTVASGTGGFVSSGTGASSYAGSVGVGMAAPNDLFNLVVPSQGSGDTTVAGGQTTATNAYRVFEFGLKTTGDAATNLRSAIQLRTQVGTGGSDSEIGFWTNQYGTGRAERMTIDKAGNVVIGATTASSKLDVTTTALGVSQTTSSGLALVNTTAAAAGAQQISPALRFSGFGWKTNATAASQAVDFRAYVLPVQGAAAPTGNLIFQSSINGGAYGDLLTLSSAGNLTVSGTDHTFGSTGAVNNYISITGNNTARDNAFNSNNGTTSWFAGLLSGGGFTSDYVISTAYTGQLRLSTAGDATLTGDLTVSGGNVGVGSASDAGQGLRVTSDALTGAAQIGVLSNPTFSSAATTSGIAGYFRIATAAAAYTMTDAIALRALAPIIGGGSSITTATGLHVQNQGAAGITNAYGIDIAAQSGAATTNVGLRNAGLTQLTNTTASTDKDTGALVLTDGGLGVEGAINSGGAITATGNVTGGNLTTAGVVSATGTGTHTFGTTNIVTAAAGVATASVKMVAPSYATTNSKTMTNDNNAVALFEVACAEGSYAGGTVNYTITCTDGTDFQAHSGVANYSVVNKAGTVTCTISETAQLETVASSSGSLTSTWTISAGTLKATINLAGVSSLAETTKVVKFTIMNHTNSAITML